jgi:rRNA maturation endonuclease Nob1
MNWFCGKCKTEFEADNSPSVFCPNCGERLTFGPPCGHWEGFCFVPE